MRWSLQQQLISYIVFTWIVAGVAGSPPQNEVAELERRELARVKHGRSRSPVRARRPSRNRAAASSPARAAPRAASPRRPAAQPRRAASAPPRSPSPQRGRSLVRTRAASRSPSPNRGAATPRRATTFNAAPSRSAGAARQRVRSPSPQRGRAAVRSSSLPRRAASSATRRAGAAQRARSPTSPQRPIRRQPVQRARVRSSKPQRKAARAAASPRARPANRTPVARAAARRQAHPPRSTVRRPTTPLGKVAARRSSSSVPRNTRSARSSIAPTGRRPAAQRASRIPVPVRRTRLSNGRTSPSAAAAPRRRTAAAAAAVLANVRPITSRSARGQSRLIPRPRTGSTTTARPRSARADTTRTRHPSGRIPVPVAKNQRGATSSRLCRRDGGLCNLPGPDSFDPLPNRPPRSQPPPNLRYGVGVGGARGTTAQKAVPALRKGLGFGTTTPATTNRPRPSSVSGGITAKELKGGSESYRHIAVDKRVVWAGPGRHAVYPAGQAIVRNPHAEHIYEAQQMVSTMRDANIREWSDISPSVEAQERVKAFMKEQIKRPSNMILLDGYSNTPKGAAIRSAQKGRSVTLDPVTGAYFNDIRLTATREARRTQQKYDSMRIKWNKIHNSAEYLPALDFVGNNRRTQALIT